MQPFARTPYASPVGEKWDAPDLRGWIDLNFVERDVKMRALVSQQNSWDFWTTFARCVVRSEVLAVVLESFKVHPESLTSTSPLLCIDLNKPTELYSETPLMLAIGSDWMPNKLFRTRPAQAARLLIEFDKSLWGHVASRPRRGSALIFGLEWKSAAQRIKINQTNSRGLTWLMYAAQMKRSQDSLEVAQLLCDKYAGEIEVGKATYKINIRQKNQVGILEDYKFLQPEPLLKRVLGFFVPQSAGDTSSSRNTVVAHNARPSNRTSRASTASNSDGTLRNTVASSRPNQATLFGGQTAAIIAHICENDATADLLRYGYVRPEPRPSITMNGAAAFLNRNSIESTGTDQDDDQVQEDR